MKNILQKALENPCLSENELFVRVGSGGCTRCNSNL